MCAAHTNTAILPMRARRVKEAEVFPDFTFSRWASDDASSVVARGQFEGHYGANLGSRGPAGLNDARIVANALRRTLAATCRERSEVFLACALSQRNELATVVAW
jgi:hypothetical protein